MTRIYPILLLICLIVIAFLWLNQTEMSVKERVLKKEIEGLQSSADSLSKVYDSILLSKDREALKAFSDAQTAANRMEGEANYWKEQAKREKAKNRVFTDQQTDSLLSLVR